MNSTGNNHSEWVNPDPERQTLHVLSHIWLLLLTLDAWFKLSSHGSQEINKEPVEAWLKWEETMHLEGRGRLISRGRVNNRTVRVK